MNLKPDWQQLKKGLLKKENGFPGEGWQAMILLRETISDWVPGTTF
jgi:hypothetical protein